MFLTLKYLTIYDITEDCSIQFHLKTNDFDEIKERILKKKIEGGKHIERITLSDGFFDFDIKMLNIPLSRWDNFLNCIENQKTKSFHPFYYMDKGFPAVYVEMFYNSENDKVILGIQAFSSSVKRTFKKDECFECLSLIPKIIRLLEFEPVKELEKV